MSFVHLHLHTQYSILDGLTNIKKLFERARELGMPAVAITDHGNMYGVKEFFRWAEDKSNRDAAGNLIVKPIVGCEVYVTRHYDHHLKDKEHSRYYHLILLAKNYAGYKNLIKIVSTAHIEGMYYRPRVSHEIIEKCHENLICSSACLAGEIAKDILADDLDSARNAIAWHKRVFGDDYYLEVMLHHTQVPGLSVDTYKEQLKVCDAIYKLAEETDTKVIATNDVHFLMQEDGPVHDRLICLTFNNDYDDPNRVRYTQEEYLKSEAEMRDLFPEHPEVIDNTLEVAAKVEEYKIDRPPILPKFNIDPEFLAKREFYLEKYADIIENGKYSIVKDKKSGEIVSKEYRGDDFCTSVAYLCYLTYEGAHKRYGPTLTEEQESRIQFELKTISFMGFPDYFLIVQDYIAASRRMGYLVGPGRGSAAGSVVAYCLWITNLDPIKYQLLFERFLNPDRINMPDIDVDFENLTAAHEYVEKTYGADHVSRVITFGTMLAKGAIKDVARISHVSIDEANRLSKMVPDRLSEKVEREYPFNPKLDELKPGFKVIEKDGKTFQVGKEDADLKTVTLASCFRLVPEMKNELENGDELNREVLKYASQLEGTIRQVGQHACATIIGPSDLTENIPICLSKDKETGLDVWTSQYDGHYIESVGMLKMDFLGLNTLSIIHKTLDNIKARHGKDIDIEAIPINDKPTFELFGRGDTTAIFQFESEGMKNWLQKLRPERLEDLIAMNALYRPGPMDYLQDFVDRKQGLKPIEYDLPEMEKRLSDTYGITVYQEQVMLLSQDLASFTKGEADTLRKAMGKKLLDVMMALKDKFMAGGMANGHPEKTLDKIWKDWEKFAEYAFNKSHATCYAWISYQTGWLKCHYTAEFLAANLSCNLSDMDEIKKIMADCKLHKIKVLNPDINESEATFTVNKAGDIRFGLGGMKGFGSNIVDTIVRQREERGPFKDVWDFVERMAEFNAVDSKNNAPVGRKPLESLVYAGAFDSFGYKRSQFFLPGASGDPFIDELVRYGELYKNDKLDNSVSLFGEMEEVMPVRPEMPKAPVDEDLLPFLQKEKEIVGMFLSSHPLDRYAFEMETFTTNELAAVGDLITKANTEQKGAKVELGGIVTGIEVGTTRNGNPSLKATIEDYSGPFTMNFYGKQVDIFRPKLELHQAVYVTGAIKPRYRGKKDPKDKSPEEFEFRIDGISMLGSVNETLLKALKVYVSEDIITSQFRKDFVKIIKGNKGPTPLLIMLVSPRHKWTMETKSKKFSVAVNSEFLGQLKALGLKYQAVK
ncbi:MAG: DNA polymerase III subunit alpha [Bacteroidales bacterium]|nr:DNA polymerase III subunit alpha [Bacteroidales bacterium]